MLKFINSQGRTNLKSMVEDFHTKFGLEPKDYDAYQPEDHDFRIKFLEEELIEYKQAQRLNDRENMLDALIDLVYVAIGTAHMYGWDFNEGFRRVHDANMTKVRVQSAEDSKRGSSLDVRKPEGWVTPALYDLVEIEE